MTVVRESAVGDFAPWIRRHAGNRDGAVLIFPHAGGTSAGYRGLADAISGDGPDAFVMQYPQRGERVAHAAAVTIQALVDDLFAAGPWADVAPLALFGHSMGALIAFEFARAAADHGIAVQQLWVSAGPAPSSVAELPGLPDNDAALIAEMAALGGTDPELLADPEFAELILPPVRSDYAAVAAYRPGPHVRIDAPVHVLGARDDARIDAGQLAGWAAHTTGGFNQTWYQGGHFYVFDQVEQIAAQVNSHG